MSRARVTAGTKRPMSLAHPFWSSWHHLFEIPAGGRYSEHRLRRGDFSRQWPYPPATRRVRHDGAMNSALDPSADSFPAPFPFVLVLLRRMADHHPGLVEDALRELGFSRSVM